MTVPHRRLYGVDVYGDLFVQVTDLDDPTVSADVLEIWVSESGDLVARCLPLAIRL